jgi:hypothetical protein
LRTSDFLAHAVARLAIPDEVMARHVEAVEAAGYREPDALARLYREWLNDSLAAFGTPRFDAAATAPATDFASWLVGRLPDPYRVTVRAHDTVRARFGDEVAIAMSSVVWRQEIAWASRMRGDDNARVACLAELWLRAARRDPAHMFKGIAEIRAQ